MTANATPTRRHLLQTLGTGFGAMSMNALLAAPPATTGSSAPRPRPTPPPPPPRTT